MRIRNVLVNLEFKPSFSPPCHHCHITKKATSKIHQIQRQNLVSSFTTLRQHLVYGKSVLPMKDSPQLDLLQFCRPTCRISVSPPPSLLVTPILLIIVHHPLYFLLRMKGHMQEMNLTFQALYLYHRYLKAVRSSVLLGFNQFADISLVSFHAMWRYRKHEYDIHCIVLMADLNFPTQESQEFLSMGLNFTI